MDQDRDDVHGEGSFVNAFGGHVRKDDDGWVVWILADGEQRVVSRHPTEAAARAALVQLNSSANPPT